MYVDLDKGCVTNAAKAMDLPGLDDENITLTRFELFSIDGPETPAFPHELDFVVRMTMGSRTPPREGTEQEHGDIYIPVLGSHELMRATLKRKVLLTDAVHSANAPMKVL